MECLDKFVILPTKKGEELGIKSVFVESNNRAFYSVIYNKNAQEFIVANMRNIIEGNEDKEL